MSDEKQSNWSFSIMVLVMLLISGISTHYIYLLVGGMDEMGVIFVFSGVMWMYGMILKFIANLLTKEVDENESNR